jgi:BioD-like phosphotransacetylase family protein
MTILYLGSDQPGAGKTAFGITLVDIFRNRGISATILKPLTSTINPADDLDPRAFETLLSQETQEDPTAIENSVTDSVLENCAAAVNETAREFDVLVVEGPSRMSAQDTKKIVTALDAKAVLVAHFEPNMTVDTLADYRNILGETLLGVIVNGLTEYQTTIPVNNLLDALAAIQIKSLGFIPEDRTLLGLTVPQIVKIVAGKFIYGEEFATGLVKHILVGGLGLDNGVSYFGLKEDKATVVRGDRPDIQMAALKTPTTCMILTQGIEPIEYVINEAEVEEVPLILTNSNTLDVMEAFGSAVNMARFDHPAKLARFEELVSQHIDLEGITIGLGLSTQGQIN